MNKVSEELIKEIEAIKNRYLDCNNCASDRHCCNNLSDEFGIELESYTATSMFGREGVKSMLTEGSLIKEGKKDFRLVNKCPLLDSKNMCKLHDKKEDLELDWCIGFPLYISWIDEKNNNFIVADLRCPCVENNIDEVKKELEKVSKKHSIKILIRC